MTSKIYLHTVYFPATGPVVIGDDTTGAEPLSISADEPFAVVGLIFGTQPQSESIVSWLPESRSARNGYVLGGIPALPYLPGLASPESLVYFSPLYGNGVPAAVLIATYSFAPPGVSFVHHITPPRPS